jgi:hypothetical protein
MGYKERLKRLNSEYRATKPAKPSGFSELPKGTYQFVVSTVKMLESKAEFAKGELEVQVYSKVLTGDYKGVMGRTNFFLEQPAKEINGKEIPAGLAQFKGFIEGMGISLPDLTDKSMSAALRELKGMKFNGYCTGKFNNVYFNSPLDTADLTIDDEEFEEDEVEEEEAEEEVEAEEEEEPEPKPIVKKKKKAAAKKAPVKKAEPVDDEDEDEDFDFEDF